MRPLCIFDFHFAFLLLQETKPYKNDPQILAVTNLVTAYQQNDVKAFERILHEDHESIMGDEFIREHIVNLVRHFRTEMLARLLRPYSRVRLHFVAKALDLGLGPKEIESLIVECILDGNLKAQIDQSQQVNCFAFKSVSQLPNIDLID